MVAFMSQRLSEIAQRYVRAILVSKRISSRGFDPPD